MSPDGTLFLRVDGVDMDPSRPAVSAADRGFGYGDGVFRTVRLAGGRVAAWHRHATKLADDLARLQLGPPDLLRIEADLADLAAEHPDCVVRITVTGGASTRGYRRRHGAPLCTVLRATLPPVVPPEAARAGIELYLCSLRLADQPALAGVKHLNRLEQVLARAEWDDERMPEGLTLDAAGHAICGTMSNLFIAEGKRLATPDLSRCGVAGVQRGRILDWARVAGIPCTIEPLPLARVLAADALVVCNSVAGAWWVRQLCDRTFARPAWHAALLDHLGQDGS
jgi:4-amino-4-deoxychorismate lyase